MTRQLWNPPPVAMLLTTVLIAACGGSVEGPDSLSSSARTARVTEADPATAGNPPPIRRAAAALQRAERDLGLVDSDRSVRISIASGHAGTLEPDQFAIAMLDPNRTVRITAVEGLQQSPELAAYYQALRQALGDDDPKVREAVVELLAAFDDPRSVSALLRARGDPSPIVREEAAEALYHLKQQPRPRHP